MIAYLTAAIIRLACPAGDCPETLGHDAHAGAREYAEAAIDGSRPHGVDPLLSIALAYHESAFDRYAVSYRGYVYGAGPWMLSPRWRACPGRLMRTRRRGLQRSS